MKEDELNAYIDRMGYLLEESGASRIMGRMMAYMMVCEPPEQSSSDLIAALGVSKAAVSTTSRDLLRAGILEKVTLRGSRQHGFRLSKGGWARIMRGRMATLQSYVEVADQGLAAMTHLPPERRARLAEFRDMYAFFVHEFPAVIDRWEKEKS